MYRILFFLILVSLLLPFSSFAAGGHDGLMCTGCHSIHDAKGNLIFAVEPNKKDLNKKNQPFTGVTALCTACHQQPDKGGMGIKPISSHMSHPYGIDNVNPKVASVPKELLRDGKFDCLGCHDPHPSNPNYRYLRADTAQGAKMATFCAVCHPMKADPKSVEKVVIFDSMDERDFKKPAAAEPVKPKPVSPEPAKPKQ